MKWVKKNIIMIAIITIIVSLPFLFNILLSIDSFYPVIGDEKTWLAFWATYIGSIMSALMVYVAIKTVQKTIALNKTTWRINWLDTYRNTAAELLVATNRVTIMQITQDISVKEYKKAANSSRNVQSSFKKSTFVMDCLFKEMDVKFKCNDSIGEEYKSLLEPYWISFQRHAGEIIQFAMLCEYIEDKELRGEEQDWMATVTKMENDMRNDGYNRIVSAILDFANRDWNDVTHDTAIKMQQDFTANVKDMELVLLKIDEECSKMAYELL